MLSGWIHSSQASLQPAVLDSFFFFFFFFKRLTHTRGDTVAFVNNAVAIKSVAMFNYTTLWLPPLLLLLPFCLFVCVWVWVCVCRCLIWQDQAIKDPTALVVSTFMSLLNWNSFQHGVGLLKMDFSQAGTTFSQLRAPHVELLIPSAVTFTIDFNPLPCSQ